MKIEGLFAPFNSWSVDLGGFRERLLPGCFDATLRADDQRALWAHDVAIPLGRVSAKTLHLSTNREGLVGWIDLASSAERYHESVARGDVRESSFGFTPILDHWSIDKETDEIQREIVIAKLYEISPVTFAAYQSTHLNARSQRTRRDDTDRRRTLTALRLAR